MPHIPPPGQAARITSFLHDHPRWSVFWDKHYRLWRVAEDDPDSDLYAEARNGHDYRVTKRAIKIRNR